MTVKMMAVAFVTDVVCSVPFPLSTCGVTDSSENAWCVTLRVIIHPRVAFPRSWALFFNQFIGQRVEE